MKPLSPPMWALLVQIGPALERLPRGTRIFNRSLQALEDRGLVKTGFKPRPKSAERDWAAQLTPKALAMPQLTVLRKHPEAYAYCWKGSATIYSARPGEGRASVKGVLGSGLTVAAAWEDAAAKLQGGAK